MLQIFSKPQPADVVIIGSGAGGGTVVKVLTDLGINVTLLEAGPMLNPETDFKQGLWPYEAPHRGAGPDAAYYDGKQEWGYFQAPNGYWNVPGEPYKVAPGDDFQWFRSRIVGGRTNHFGRFTPRFSDYDFKPYSLDGLSDDWPINYDEMSPYFDKAEEFIGVTGANEGLRSAPNGKFQPPPPPRVHEVLMQRAGKKLGIPVIPARLAMLSKSINGRGACHYCAQCSRGCKTGAAFSSSQAMIFPALKTGRLTLITGAMARELILDQAGKVSAVSYIDKATMTEQQIRCRSVVLAASSCESARLLLNSKSRLFPNGLANGSGAVGKYLTDSVAFAMFGYVPALEGVPRHNSDGMGGNHIYIPWWLLDDKKKNFPRGYHVQVGGGFSMPGLGSFGGEAWSREGYGSGLKAAIRQSYGSLVLFAGFGEMIPNSGSYCEIDPDGAVDQFGIPVLRFHWRWSDYELNQVGHMRETFKALIESMGGKANEDPNVSNQSVIRTGGSVIHELGTVRMGDDSSKAPLNRWCQAHDVKNLFVADGGPFVSNPEKNPTLAIVALAWRTAEYLAGELRKGNV